MSDQLELDNIAPEGEFILVDKPRELYYTMESVANIVRRHGSIKKLFEKVEKASANPMDLDIDILDSIADFIAQGLTHYNENIDSAFIMKHMTLMDIGGSVQLAASAIAKCTNRRHKGNPQ
jgi:hypothetical protein